MLAPRGRRLHRRRRGIGQRRGRDRAGHEDHAYRRGALQRRASARREERLSRPQQAQGICHFARRPPCRQDGNGSGQGGLHRAHIPCRTSRQELARPAAVYQRRRPDASADAPFVQEEEGVSGIARQASDACRHGYAYHRHRPRRRRDICRRGGLRQGEQEGDRRGDTLGAQPYRTTHVRASGLHRTETRPRILCRSYQKES